MLHAHDEHPITIHALKDQAWQQYKVNDGSNKRGRHISVLLHHLPYYHQLDAMVELTTINVLNDDSN